MGEGKEGEEGRVESEGLSISIQENEDKGHSCNSSKQYQMTTHAP